ncbi:PEPxxWA-CTERM sorting domain-containing protein [Sphingomonas tabacisoli]|uniref:PEPxxWA-CTERM sorting domain-containing protein n=1 Tax=Sphingomonas tabacisoli TaxID=2249466 RepID=A0ABW4I3M3_9SPHN
MFKRFVAAAVLAGVSFPAGAMTYMATVKGVVDSTFDTAVTAPGATSRIEQGDTITATFTFMKIETLAEALAASFGNLGSKKVDFRLDGYTWTSAGDFGASIMPVDFDAGLDPLANYYSTMDDAKGAGDLRVNGYTFEIGEFGYDLYTGPGFKGHFDQSTLAVWVNGRQVVSPTAMKTIDINPSLVAAPPVPEPAVWAMMIAGFGLAGTALRTRKQRFAFA